MHACRIAFLMLAGFSLTAQQQIGTSQGGVNFYSIEKEAALGRELAAGFLRHTTPIESQAVQEYLDRIGQRIGSQLRSARFPFTFSAVTRNRCRTTHEPSAFPGGYVFVPAGLFLAAQDEAEFGGMLAHAMAHIALRHGTRQATRGQLVNLSSIPLIFMSTDCPEVPGIPLGFLSFQRGYELEADALGVRTMARAGFDPSALVRYIERVQPAESTPKGHSALPDRDQRVARMRSVIEQLPLSDYPGPGEEFTAIQQEVRELTEPHTPVKPPPTLKREQ